MVDEQQWPEWDVDAVQTTRVGMRVRAPDAYSARAAVRTLLSKHLPAPGTVVSDIECEVRPADPDGQFERGQLTADVPPECE